MQRLIQAIVIVCVTGYPLTASGDGPYTTCGNYCHYNWQYICPQEHPAGIPGNPVYCWDMYRACLSYNNLPPDAAYECDPPSPWGSGGGDDDNADCTTPGCENSPIYVNLADPAGQRDYGLTSAEAGLYFDVDNDGTAERTAWAGPRSTAALLVHPNPDGSVTSGLNLFGNATGWPNGYEMLRSAYDENNDGVISAEDLRASELWLWSDGQGGPGAAWDGVAQPEELRPFLAIIERLWLNERTTGYVDEHGNQARWVGRAQLVKYAPAESGGKGPVVNTADWILRSLR